MKRAIVWSIVWCSLFLFSMGYAEEEQPILVIDPHGHSSRIAEILFTPDGKTLLSFSEDKTIRLWDTDTGDLQKTLRPPTGDGRNGMIFSGALSPDGKILAAGMGLWAEGLREVPVYLFDLLSGEIIGTLEGHEDIISGLDFSQDGKWLVSGSSSSIYIWDMSTIGVNPAPVVILEGESGVFNLAFSPDGQKLVSGHVDGALRLWELPKDMGGAAAATPQKLDTPQKVLKKHTNIVDHVEYSPDGKYIMSADYDGNKFLWDHKGKLKKKFTSAGGAGIAFSRNGENVVLSSGAEAIVYSVPRGKKRTTFTKHTSPVEVNAFSNCVSAIAFYGNDLVATAGGIDFEIYIWDVKTGDVKTHIAGQGKRVEAVGIGDDFHVAFGNTPGGLHDIGPLERSFDLSEMMLHQRFTPDVTFTRAQKTYQDKTLHYEFGKWYELQIKGGGTITNEPHHGWVRSYTFTPTGDVVVGSSHVLRLHRDDGTLIRNFVGHTGEIWDVSVSPDGRLLVSASDDQTLRIWNLATGECLATVFIARDREWVCWTPNGYYAASAGGEKYIGWHLNQGMKQTARYYPVSVFRKQYYQPELVKRTIALANFEKAFTEFNLQDRNVTQVLPPKVQWMTPESSLVETTQTSIRIQASIQSEDELTALKILVNGRTQTTARGLTLDSVPGDVVDQEIPLMAGKNVITIFAANKNAGANSDERIVIYQADAEEKPNLYMVSIGISQYLREELTLEYADDDAKAVSQLFRGQEGALYQKVLLQELYDTEATQANIKKSIAWLQQQTTHKDVVLLFIAAHGTNEQGRYYLLPADCDLREIHTTGLSWNVFSETLGNLPARVLLFLDTCHSGQLGQDVYAQRKQVDNTEALRELSSDEYGVVILAASTGREFSLEHPEWGHGAFTKALLEALEQGQADYSNDGMIHLRELDLYVAERVELLTNGEQHPTTQKPSTISRFPVVQVK